MKTTKPHSPSGIRKHLSPGEQKKLDQFQRQRSDHPTETTRGKGVVKAARHTLMLAACAAGLLVGGTTLHAEEPHAVSVPGLFNDANAAQRAGRLGPAILDYERASFLAPGDPAIAQNLHAAREKAGVAAPVIPLWQQPAHWLSFNGMALLGSFALLMMCMLMFCGRLVPFLTKGNLGSLRVVAGAVMLYAVAALAIRWPELDRAVVVGAHASAHIAPAASSEAAFELKPGELVSESGMHGSFVLIRTLDQRSGWMARTDVERIVLCGTSISSL